MKKTNLGIGNGRKLLITTAIAAMMMVGGASAYFTATDNANNTWTVGTVTIDLHEDAYDAAQEERENIMPNAELSKDPIVTNSGNNPAYVFMKFSVPKADIKVASQDGTAVNQAVQELFDYSISDGWSQVSVVEGDDSNTYLYVYGTSTSCQSLMPNASTPVLFDGGKITFKNIVEGQGLEGTTLEIPVEAFAIQTANLTDGNVTTPSAVWSVLSGQTN